MLHEVSANKFVGALRKGAKNVRQIENILIVIEQSNRGDICLRMR